MSAGRALRATALALALAALLTAGGAQGPTVSSRLLGGVSDPAPEATVTPDPGSWHAVAPPAGYRITLVVAGAGAVTDTLVAAVRDYARAHGVALTTLAPAAADDDVDARFADAVSSSPDLVVAVGDGVVDRFAPLTAQFLGQQFLLLGSQLPEPTENVTAVVWPGAQFRGTGLGNDPASPQAVTPERASDAVAAGVASVVHELTGIVLWLG